MSVWASKRKCDLKKLAIEFGVSIEESDTVVKIIRKLTECSDYEEAFALAQCDIIEKDRKEKEKEEKLQRERDFEIAKLKAEREGDSLSLTSNQSEREPKISLKSVLPKFDTEKSEISIYLSLFERQAQKAQIDKEQWVTHLLGLIPTDLGELILREPSPDSDNFDYVKKILLERFQLSPEDFRIKFVKVQKLENKTWKDLVYDTSNYFDQWLSGLDITKFDQLRDLIISDQIKRKVSPEMKQHFIDSWGTMNSPFELAKKLDAYDAARKNVRKLNPIKPQSPAKAYERNRIPEKQKIESKPEEMKNNWRAKDNDKNRDAIFDRKRETICFLCKRPGHVRHFCPELKKSEQTARVNHVPALDDLEIAFKSYLSKGLINGKIMNVLRDSGSSYDFISSHDINLNQFTGEKIWVKQALSNDLHCLPIAKIELDMGDGKAIFTKAAVVSGETDMTHYLLGNKSQELLDAKTAQPQFINAVFTRQRARLERQREVSIPPEEPPQSDQLSKSGQLPLDGESPFPGSVISTLENDASDEGVRLTIEEDADESGALETEDDRVELPPVMSASSDVKLANVSKEELCAEQTQDQSLNVIWEKAEQNKSHFQAKEGLLLRVIKDHRGGIVEQIVLPLKFRRSILSLCHEGVGSHLGINKTKDKIFRNYFWPNAVNEIEKYVKSCDPCQRIGKAGDQKRVPLKNVPIVTSIFTRLCVDTVGPLPLSENGNRHMLTATCASSRYPESLPIKDLRSVTIIDALTLLFSRLGYPREIQTDLGRSFVSELTSEFLERFGVKIVHSSVHRPQSQAVERWHRTVKRLLKVLCLEAGNTWEKNLPYALLALRTVTHDSTGFSPSELVHGRNLRTPERLLYEQWKGDEESSTLVTEYVFDLLNRMQRCQELAIETMGKTQEIRKKYYDRDTVDRKFQVGDKVLVLALNKTNKFSVNWTGPGTIQKRISETNYIVNMPHRRNPSQIYHINLLKPYLQREHYVNLVLEEHYDTKNSEFDLEIPQLSGEPDEYDFQNIISDSALAERCDANQISELGEVLGKMRDVFSNKPGRTDLIAHDIELISDAPVRMRPYRNSPRQAEILKSQIQRMLELGVIIEGESEYNSPIILVEAPGREVRPCIDYRRLNAITRPEIFPLPNIEERVEQVAKANYITILDLTKGYWQIPMTPRAQKIAAFVTSWGSYLPVTMPFGLVGASYRFSKFMSIILRGLEEFCLPYLDDMAIFSDNWDDHLKHIEMVLNRIREAKITIKLSKCRFAQRTVKYLGHIVGDGQRKPAEAKIEAITRFPTPRSKTEIRRFLGLTGYYARYIKNYAIIVEPLTRALKGKIRKAKISWDAEMEKAFCTLKSKLTENPVLFAPNYAETFIIQTDASDKGIGIIMAQRINSEEHPIIYLSRKFTHTEEKFSASEKECCAIIFAIKKLKHYLDGQSFIIETDHNPLIWLKNNAGNNPRLIRWSLILQPYNYSIKHRPGKDIPHVDCLSRSE